LLGVITIDNYNLSDILDSYFPEALKNHEQYKVLIDLAKWEFCQVDAFIRMISLYSNVDRCPEEFLQHLADIVGFTYNTNLDADTQRECIKFYLNDITTAVGRPEDLENMATYGDIEGYLGGGVFVPGTNTELPKATLIMARDRCYTHSKSFRSGDDVYPSDIFREGVVLITVTRLNDIIMDKVETVKPAGLLVVYQIANASGGFDYITHTNSY
jgi:hypothetical protein